jgi:hypothetical protein
LKAIKAKICLWADDCNGNGYSREVWGLEIKEEIHGQMMYLNPRWMLYADEGAARPSEDDHIIFSGVDGTLFVPFGRGKEVYEAILAAIGKLKERAA